MERTGIALLTKTAESSAEYDAESYQCTFSDTLPGVVASFEAKSKALQETASKEILERVT